MQSLGVPGLDQTAAVGDGGLHGLQGGFVDDRLEVPRRVYGLARSGLVPVGVMLDEPCVPRPDKRLAGEDPVPRLAGGGGDAAVVPGAHDVAEGAAFEDDLAAEADGVRLIRTQDLPAGLEAERAHPGGVRLARLAAL